MGILTNTIAQEASGLLAWKPPVDVVATTNVASLSGLQTIDGVTGAEGLSVLLAAQTSGAQNGVYLMSAGAWTRRSDMDISAECIIGTNWRITRGSLAGTRYWLSGPVGTTITLGTTTLTIVAESAGGGAGAFTSVSASSFISIGGTPAASGEIRLSTGTALRWRNTANTADVDGLLKDSGDNIFVGDSTDATSITQDVKTGGYVRVRVNAVEQMRIEPHASGGRLQGTGTVTEVRGNLGLQVEAQNGLLVLASTGGTHLQCGGATRVLADPTGLGFFGATPVAKPTVTGSRGGNAALASFLTALANLGLITDSTTA